MTVGPVSRDEATAEFFDGTAAGQFLLRHCAACGTLSAPQAVQCERCRSAALGWRAAAGDATLVSWAVAHGQPGVEPVVLCIGELAEGPWWWSRLENSGPEELRPGLPLRIEYRRHDPEAEAVPVFVPGDVRPVADEQGARPSRSARR